MHTTTLEKNKYSKKVFSFSGIALAILFTVAIAASAYAATPPTAPGLNKLLCFDGTTEGGGYGGVCTLKANGAKGPATLDNTDTNPNGDYSGVYFQESTLFGQSLGSVTQLGYNYTGNITPMPGNLSLNLPLDTDGDITNTETYAFIDAYYCPGTDGSVDVIHDGVCGIWVDGIEYANWAALVAAHPTWSVANNYPFVIAERTPSEVSALWTVANVKLGKSGK